MTYEIAHDAAARRFETRVDGEHCTLDYTLDAPERGSAVMTITHVLVPDPVGGRGIAAALTEAALGHARAKGWRVIPRCPYAAAYMRRHPASADLLADT
ncbi:MAG TPA: GNAT family N-acetyltransferase [Rhodanobacteraceae bacterium]|nr:GNAT family N-acetyltransferase [Rhodanobacteraceae bacterium]